MVAPFLFGNKVVYLQQSYIISIVLMKKVTLANNIEIDYYTPKEIKKHLDEYIIGQDDAKKSLSVAIYNHYKRMILTMSQNETITDKSNIIMVGPTGCGKSAMVKRIADYIGVPCYIADATTLTQAGYVGDDVESILSGLLRASYWNKNRAEYGIVVIDEVDKLAKRGSNQHISRDVVGEGVQQALLKMVEGDMVGVPPQEGRKHPDQPLIYINTKNILFIATGAFSGIEDIIKGRLRMNRIGYTTETKCDDDDSENLYSHISQEDLRQYGMIPEFIGRFPVITNVNQLTKDDLVKILTEPKNSLVNQYKEMMGVDNIDFNIDKEGLELVAEISLKLKTGARGLRSIMESIFNDFVYDFVDDDELDKTEITITKDYIKKSLHKRYSTMFDQ